MIRTGMVGLFVLFAGLSMPPAQASDVRVRLLASTCQNCHGPDGKSVGAVPSLAGQDPGYLFKAMLDCKTGDRATTVMQKYMLGYSDEELQQLAAYFSAIQ